MMTDDAKLLNVWEVSYRRVLLNLSVRALATKVGICREHMGKALRGLRPLPYVNIVKLASLLQVPPRNIIDTRYLPPQDVLELLDEQATRVAQAIQKVRAHLESHGPITNQEEVPHARRPRDRRST